MKPQVGHAAAQMTAEHVKIPSGTDSLAWEAVSNRVHSSSPGAFRRGFLFATEHGARRCPSYNVGASLGEPLRDAGVWSAPRVMAGLAGVIQYGERTFDGERGERQDDR